MCVRKKENYLVPKDQPSQGKVQNTKWDNQRSYDRVAEDNG